VTDRPFASNSRMILSSSAAGVPRFVLMIIAFFPLCLLDYRAPRGRCGPAPPRAVSVRHAV
jgi:hypothetical protein